MLVLSRKLDEKIIVGDGDSRIVIQIVDIGRNKVRVGIEAPNHVNIVREEIVGTDKDRRKERPLVQVAS